MTVELAIELIQALMTQSVIIVAPMLMTSVSIGVSISLVQTVTSIQDQTLSFVPKIFGVGMIAIVSSHWMVRSLMDFTTEMFNRIGSMGP